jgi:hypothetical protein
LHKEIGGGPKTRDMSDEKCFNCMERHFVVGRPELTGIAFDLTRYPTPPTGAAAYRRWLRSVEIQFSREDHFSLAIGNRRNSLRQDAPNLTFLSTLFDDKSI